MKLITKSPYRNLETFLIFIPSQAHKPPKHILECSYDWWKTFKSSHPLPLLPDGIVLGKWNSESARVNIEKYTARPANKVSTCQIWKQTSQLLPVLSHHAEIIHSLFRLISRGPSRWLWAPLSFCLMKGALSPKSLSNATLTVQSNLKEPSGTVHMKICFWPRYKILLHFMSW